MNVAALNCLACIVACLINLRVGLDAILSTLVGLTGISTLSSGLRVNIIALFPSIYTIRRRGKSWLLKQLPKDILSY